MINLLQPENDVEAAAIKQLLEDHGITVKVVSYHDTAYDGLFQSQYGWGVIKVSEADVPAAKQLIQEWKDAAPSEIPWMDESTE